MANELPYFRFTVQAWQNGDISLEPYELKGLFIDVCGYYWVKDCSITLALLKKRFSNAKGLDELIKLDIIKHEGRHDKVEIVFLNKQYDLLSEKRKRRQAAGSKGGKAKAMVKQSLSYKDKDKDNNKDKDKTMIITPKLVFPFDSEKFLFLWGVLSKQKKWKKKSPEALQMSLKKLSEHTEQDVIKMLENAIAGEWQGIHELNNKNNGDTTPSREQFLKNLINGES